MRLLPVLVIGFVLMGGSILLGADDKTFSLTTYFPASKSDYHTVKTTRKFSVPEKIVGNNTTLVSGGEVWLEQEP